MSTTLLDGQSQLLDGQSQLLDDPGIVPANSGLTPLPMGTGETLIWQGGTANNDPTVAANWNPNHAPQMAANQTLVMNSGTMNLDGGNLAANQLNVSTASDKTATINLKNHGSLDVNVPDTAKPNIAVNMSGGGEAVMNLFSGPNSDPNVTISIDSSKLDLQANMTFGHLTTKGSGTTYLQGDSHLNGSSVILDTKLEGFGSVELGSAGTQAGRMELAAPLPSGVSVNVLDNKGQGGSNGLIMDKSSESTTAGGPISLQDGFVKLMIDATSYTMQNGEFDFYNNGTKIDALNVSSAAGSGPLQVGFNTNGAYIYNCSTSTMPLGAGNGMGSGGGGGMMSLVATDSLSPLPMHA